MDVILIIVYVYLGIGFVYAMYIWLFAGDSWTAIPINTVGGPINIIYQTIRALLRRVVEVKEVFRGKEAVIFDLDGTIIDSKPAWDKALETTLEEIEAAWADQNLSVGIGEVEKWEIILKDNQDIETELSAKELSDKTAKEFLKIYKNVEPLDGFWDLVKYLKEKKKYKIGLVTNTGRAVTDELIERMGIGEAFDYTVTGDEVKKRKPSPEIYKKAAKGLGVSPRKIVVFEDSVIGAKAARKAGMEVVVIWNGADEYPDDFPKGSRFFLPDFTEVSSAIEKNMKEELEELVKEMEEQEKQVK